MVMSFRVGGIGWSARVPMTYFVSLKITAIIIGILALLGHLPAALMPEKFGPILKSLPRNYPLGVVLMMAATLWFTVLTGLMDLGEISSARVDLMIGVGRLRRAGGDFCTGLSRGAQRLGDALLLLGGGAGAGRLRSSRQRRGVTRSRCWPTTG